MHIAAVDDPRDPRLNDFRALMDADVRPDRRGVVIAEGVNVVTRLAASRYRVRAVIGVPDRLAAVAPALAHVDVPGFAVDKWLLSDVVGFRVTRGILASADRPAARSVASVVAGARSVAVLEGLNDFENLGALFRNAAAFGVEAVVLDAHCADPLYRRSVRVSMGHVLRVPFASADALAAEVVPELGRLGFTTYALTPRASARTLRSVRPDGRWAVLLGAEGPGLSEAALAVADEQIRIPMADGVDSLNVATAAAVAFAHFVP